MYVSVKELPESLVALLKSLGYNRTDISVETAEHASPFGAGQDGYREFCAILNLSTGERKVEWGSWGGANIFVQRRVDSDDNSYEIPPNFVVVNGRMGGNQPVYATLTVRPDMVAKYLPERKKVTARQQWIIDVLAVYTSAGRKEEFSSYGRIPPSKEEMLELEKLGMIKVTKSGATSLTLDGKNAKSPGLCVTPKYIAPEE